MTDLRELLGRVRDPLAREQLDEAITCYYAGSYRAAIVTTWVSVVFDFVSKLRELDMTGNAGARTKLRNLEDARTSHNLPILLSFEKNLIQEAVTTYELISPVERVDLERLYEDRNRCAHPSLTSLEEAFHPSAELARSHIVAAVSNMLGQAPIQGAAAASRIFEAVESDFFPTEIDQAVEYLQHGPLSRAKDSLIRSVIIGISKDLMTANRTTSGRKRQYATLNAVHRMYSSQFADVLSNNLPQITESVSNSDTRRILLYAGQVTGAWNALGRPAQLKCINLVTSGPIENDAALLRAIQILELRPAAISRLPEVNANTLARMLEVSQDIVLKERGLELFEGSNGFRSAEENLRRLITPFGSALTSTDMERIALAFRSNGQIRFASLIPSLLFDLFNSGVNTAMYATAWRSIHAAICESTGIGDTTTLVPALQQRYGLVPCATPVEEQPQDDELDDEIPF